MKVHVVPFTWSDWYLCSSAILSYVVLQGNLKFWPEKFAKGGKRRGKGRGKKGKPLKVGGSGRVLLLLLPLN